uniref:Putative subtilisin-like protease n=1 Tax=Davidia involucrata TaxID=16924 RepID=A0A5B7BG00_DAVIN
MKFFTNGSKVCSGAATNSPGNLNYPSFSVVFKPNSYIQELKRTVTNVGELSPEMYKVRIIKNRDEKVYVSVKPESLIFNKSHEKQSYTVKFKSNYVYDNSSSIVKQMVFGSILWESDRHVVRSSFAIIWDKN